MDDAQDQEFVHNIAIKLSRVLNLTNPNDYLARNVIGIATANDLPGFVQGKHSWTIYAAV